MVILPSMHSVPLGTGPTNVATREDPESDHEGGGGGFPTNLSEIIYFCAYSSRTPLDMHNYCMTSAI